MQPKLNDLIGLCAAQRVLCTLRMHNIPTDNLAFSLTFVPVDDSDPWPEPMRDLTALVAALARVVKDERGTGEFRRRVRLRSLQLLDAVSALWGGMPPKRHIVSARTACVRLSTLLTALHDLGLVFEDQLVIARALLRKTADLVEAMASRLAPPTESADAASPTPAPASLEENPPARRSPDAFTRPKPGVHLPNRAPSRLANDDSQSASSGNEAPEMPTHPRPPR